MKYVLGNVRIGQNRLEDAFELHKSSLACWKITMGEQHHKTGDCYHKVGWHYARLGQWDDARCVLSQPYSLPNKQYLGTYPGTFLRFGTDHLLTTIEKCSSKPWLCTSRERTRDFVMER